MDSLDRMSYWELDRGAGERQDGEPRPTDDVAEGDRLAGTVRFDVAVVGAGVAGLMIAASLAPTGRSIVVLEAREVGSGTTGHSTAKVTALHGLTYDDLESRRGPEIARGYAQANMAGIEQFAQLIETYGIDCGWERQPAYTYAEDVADAGAIVAEAEAAERAGLPVHTTTDLPLPYGVAAAVSCEGQAQLDPRRFCEGLARALRSQGVQVHQHTRVLKVDEGSPHVLHLDDARVEAGAVVIATQLPFHDPGLYFSRTTPSRSYALAARLRHPVPEGMYLGIGRTSRSIRHVTEEPHIGIFGGPSHQTGEGGDTTEHLEELERWVRRRFDVDDVLARWSAQDRMPPDDVPFIGRMPRSAGGVYLATGFRKWGFTNSAVAAQIISAQIDGRTSPWSEVFDSRRAPTSTRAIAQSVGANAKVVCHFVGDRIRTVRPPSADELQPGEGRIVQREGTKVAAYRDEDGTLHALSARCTHLGCLVAWNSAERSWDCPCHGSRFSFTGTVIDGPAVEPLPPIPGE